MLIIRLIFVTISIFGLIGADQFRRYRDIDVKLISENDDTFEIKMREILQKSASILFENDIIADISNSLKDLTVGSRAGNVSEFMNLTTQLLSAVKEIFTINNENLHALVREIPIEIERSNVRQDIVNMEAKIKTILFNCNYLNGSVDIENVVKKSIVHDMHNDILDMVNIFDHPKSEFRKHPLFAVPLLLSISSFVAVYNRIEADFNPQLANRSIVGCKIQHVLQEYQPLATIDRLTKIKIIPAGNIFTNVHTAMKSRFDDARLDENFDCKIVGGRSTPSFKDRWSNDSGYVTHKNNDGNTNGCITDLMVFIKYRIEDQFEKAIDLLNESCPPQKRTRQQSKTGSLLFSISFQSEIQSYLNNSIICCAFYRIWMVDCQCIWCCLCEKLFTV